MLPYQTPSKILAANAEATRIMADKDSRKGPSQETPEQVRARAGDKTNAR